jgi:cyanophycin synthetase
LPFDDSRRLTGSNLFFNSTGAVLELVKGAAIDEALLSGWRTRVVRARSWLRWPDSERVRSIAIRRHAAGVSLALAAPCDQLFTATEINEWALCAALIEADPNRWAGVESALIDAAIRETPMAVAFASSLPVLDEQSAFARFAALSKIEASPRLRSLVAAADEHRLQRVLDDDLLTLGCGAGGRTWPVDALPHVVEVPWSKLYDVPCAIVTGSNGKTTTVRVLAACVRAHGWHDGYNCTDGLFVAGEKIRSGDYSGPVGTRTILRDTRIEAAILETARGGILRRGLAAQRARVAIVTNVSADHFGEYGIHDLAGLADVKLVVANTIDYTGLLVLNADDPLLRARANQLACPIGWFSHHYDDAMLKAHRRRGGATSGVRDGRLLVNESDIGAVAEMPLTVGGSADYNISNVAGAALAACALDVPPATVATVLARFGADPNDNPGRLMRYDYRGAHVLVDYAHNPEGLGGVLSVAARLRQTGRIAVLLGQAGNRETADIERLARTAARFRPDFVVIKEIEAYLRGRAPGEVPAIIEAALLQAGLPASALEVHMTELGAVERMLEWSRPGDILVLPVHDPSVREQAIALIHQSFARPRIPAG